MPDTALGITYPASTDHTRLWEHLQGLADDVNTLITADRTKRDAVFTSWSPTITGSTSGTWVAGATVNNSRYLRIGRLVLAWVDLTLGAGVSISGSITGSMIISLPVTAAASQTHVGDGLIAESSPAGRWVVAAEINTTTTVVLVQASNGAIVTNNTPAASVWATGDTIRLKLEYEANAAA